MKVQTHLAQQQQETGTDSFDYSIAKAISIRRPDNGHIVLENRSPLGLFDFVVRMQGTGELGTSSDRDAQGRAFMEVVQPVDALAPCERVTIQLRDDIDSSVRMFDQGSPINKGWMVHGYEVGTAVLGFRGSLHWWAVSEGGGLFRVSASSKSLDAMTDTELLNLTGSMPENEVLADTVLEGVDRDGISLLEPKLRRDGDLVPYRDSESEIGASSAGEGISHEPLSDCSFG